MPSLTQVLHHSHWQKVCLHWMPLPKFLCLFAACPAMEELLSEPSSSSPKSGVQTEPSPHDTEWHAAQERHKKGVHNHSFKQHTHSPRGLDTASDICWVTRKRRNVSHEWGWGGVSETKWRSRSSSPCHSGMLLQRTNNRKPPGH